MAEHTPFSYRKKQERQKFENKSNSFYTTTVLAGSQKKTERKWHKLPIDVSMIRTDFDIFPETIVMTLNLSSSQLESKYWQAH